VQHGSAPGLTNKDVAPQQISFADALIANGGNLTKAAIAVGYSAKTAAVTGSKLSVNPQGRALLRARTEQMLDFLAPLAVEQLRKLLWNKSGYVRLEAVKDILNRDAIGVAKEAPKTAPLVVNINLGAADQPQRAAAEQPQLSSKRGREVENQRAS
jgi:phage terminase small subunit